MHSTALPINKPRILTIDALRGFALFGIFFAHMIMWYAGGPLPQEYYQRYTDAGSIAASVIYMLLINAKFFAIFSFLFGLSFYIQMQSLEKKYRAFATRFAWRLAILGVIGFIHHSFWRADILTIYVPLGFLLLLCRHLSDKAVLIIGLVLIFNLPTKLAEVIAIGGFHHYPLLDDKHLADAANYLTTITQGNIIDIFKHNLNAIDEKAIFQINSGRVWMTFGFFLLGMYVGRKKWFENIEENKLIFTTICKKSAWGFLVIFITAVVIMISVFLLKIQAEGNQWLMWLGRFLFDSLNACLTLIYISGFALLMLKPRWFNVLSTLAPAGKMALTTYLTQSLIGVLIFFNVGLGIFPFTSPGENALLAIAIFGLQIFVCRWWLQHFNYGPIEWLWRSGTDLKWQKMWKS